MRGRMRGRHSTQTPDRDLHRAYRLEDLRVHQEEAITGSQLAAMIIRATYGTAPEVSQDTRTDAGTPGQASEPSTQDRQETDDMMTVKITTVDHNPPGKLAEAELHFTEGPLVGLKLIGFGIWERRTGGGRNVTFPARTYSVNGERRSFALLRPTGDATAQDRIRELILAAYAAFEQEGGQS